MAGRSDSPDRARDGECRMARISEGCRCFSAVVSRCYTVSWERRRRVREDASNLLVLLGAGEYSRLDERSDAVAVPGTRQTTITRRTARLQGPVRADHVRRVSAWRGSRRGDLRHCVGSSWPQTGDDVHDSDVLGVYFRIGVFAGVVAYGLIVILALAAVHVVPRWKSK